MCVRVLIYSGGLSDKSWLAGTVVVTEGFSIFLPYAIYLYGIRMERLLYRDRVVPVRYRSVSPFSGVKRSLPRTPPHACGHGVSYSCFLLRGRLFLRHRPGVCESSFAAYVRTLITFADTIGGTRDDRKRKFNRTRRTVRQRR